MKSDIDPSCNKAHHFRMEDYFRQIQNFQKYLSINPMSKKEARYFLFRMSCSLMQKRLPLLLDLDKVPKTFLHGNPHIDNYAKTFLGSAMIDFDRARIGPYCWDIIRFLISLSLRREKESGFLDDTVIVNFIDAYFIHFSHPDIPSKQLKMLKTAGPEKWQMTTKDYLRANKKWAKKMRDFAVDPNDKDIRGLLKSYVIARDKGHHLLTDYVIGEVGMVPGSFGKIHYIYAMQPKNVDSYKDAILLDIKEVYQEKDNKYFYSPTAHHGERMILASKIYADSIEEKLGYCTYNGKQFWGRQVPCFSQKVKKFLSLEEQKDFAYTVGSELGKGHRKGLLRSSSPREIEADFTENFDKYLHTSMFLTSELDLAFETMKKKIELQKKFKGK